MMGILGVVTANQAIDGVFDTACWMSVQIAVLRIDQRDKRLAYFVTNYLILTVI